MWLTIQDGPRKGTRVEASGERFVLGREEGCDLVLDDEEVSRQHAYLNVLADGTAELHDLGSSNGTRVDGSFIRGSVVLRGGETIRVGSTSMRVESARDAGATRMAQPEVVGPPPPPPPPSGRRGGTKVPVPLMAAGAAAVVGVAAVGGLFAAGVFGGSDTPSLQRVVADARPSVVRVNATDSDGLGGSGSGWVLDAAAGLIVTNHHVVNSGSLFTVAVLKSGTKAKNDAEDLPLEERDATVVGTAPCEDLAVLRTDPKDLQTMPLGDQTKLRQGDQVSVLGFPGTQSARTDYIQTSGTVADVHTSFSNAKPRSDVPDLPNLVLTTAKINPGHSGGPLVNDRGQLVGVSTGSDDSLDQNYAIGVDRVRTIVDQLRRGVSIGWTGMGLEFSPKLKGAIVTGVVPQTPAATANIRPPQLLTAIDGQDLRGTLADYCALVKDLPRRATINITLTPLRADPTDPSSLSVSKGAKTRTIPLALK